MEKGIAYSVKAKKARKDFRERKRPEMLARRRAFEKKMPNWKLKTASNQRKPGRISGSESDQEFL